MLANYNILRHTFNRLNLEKPALLASGGCPEWGLRYDEARDDGKQARSRLSSKEGGKRGDAAPISVAEEICDRSNLSKKSFSFFPLVTHVCLSTRPSVNLMYAERHHTVFFIMSRSRGRRVGRTSWTTPRANTRRWDFSSERAGERRRQLIQSILFRSLFPFLSVTRLGGAMYSMIAEDAD